MAPELKTLIPEVKSDRQPPSIQIQQPGPSLLFSLSGWQQVGVGLRVDHDRGVDAARSHQHHRESPGGVLYRVVHSTQSLLSS